MHSSTAVRRGLSALAAAATVFGASAATLTAVAARPALACDTCDSAFEPGTYTGEAKRVGNGVAYSWVTLGENGKPVSIGVTLTETALQGLPETLPDGIPSHGYMLMLPKEAAKTAFDHVGVDWNPKGHDPLGIYDRPHFDLHFYQISAAERMKITAVGDDAAKCEKPVPASFAPQGYVMAPKTAVPMMGSHWVDPKSPELNGQPFTKTFLYGSYDGKMAFYEPMITNEYLAKKESHSEEIKQPASYQKSGFYPTRYTIRFDAARREYTVALEGMTWREGTDAEAKAAVAAARKPRAATPLAFGKPLPRRRAAAAAVAVRR